jgi:hypothetical protein
MIECFYLEVLPDVAHSQYIRKIREIANDPDSAAIDFVPMEIDEISALVEKMTDAVSVCNEGVEGRGVEYPSVAKCYSAINTLHKEAGVVSPCQSKELQEDLAMLHKAYKDDEHGSPSFDAAVFKGNISQNAFN